MPAHRRVLCDRTNPMRRTLGRPESRKPLPSTLRCQLLAASLQWPLGAAALQSAAMPDKVWRVGAGLAVSHIADAIQQAAGGDIIEILPGIYAGDMAVIHQRRLQLIGLGSGPQDRPHLLAAGGHADGKAIWVVRNGDIRLENLDFEGARVPDGNGAAICFEGGRLALQQCGFHNHEIGLLIGNRADAQLSFMQCEFSRAPVNRVDLSHLIYVGRIGHFRLQDCRLGAGREGHLVKSHARQTVIVDNLPDDGPNGQASYEIDLPEGGDALVEGNTMVQSTGTRNPVMLSYGAEGGRWPLNQLTLRRITYINRLPSGGWFVRVWAHRLPGPASVLSQNNRYLGPGSLLLGPGGRSVDDWLNCAR